MFAIGFQITSRTSPKAKQYTAVLLKDGTLIKNWGASSSNGTYNSSKNVVPAAAMSELKKVYASKNANPDYDQLVISFQSVDLGNFTDAINFGSTNFPSQINLEKVVKKYRELASKERADVQPKNHGLNSNKVLDGIGLFNKDQMSPKSQAFSGASAPIVRKTPTAPVPAVEVRFTKVESKVLRPNGEQYRPRQIMGHTDVALLREFRSKGVFVRLAGPPGGGKTALAEAAFNDLITVNGHGDMTVAHFVGSYLPDPKNGNSWIWHNGPLVRAMEAGVPLFVDEGTRIPTEVLNILFSVMDGRGTLNIDDRPDLPAIKAKKGFYVIMGYNPETLGARALDEALISRFRVQIDVYTDHNTAKALGVPAMAIRIAKNLETRDKKDRESGGPGVWVPQMRELLTFRDLIKMNTGEEFALATLVASCPRVQDIPEVIKVIKDVAKQSVALPALGGLV